MGQEEKRVRKVREAVAKDRDPQGPSTMGSMCHGPTLAWVVSYGVSVFP